MPIGVGGVNENEERRLKGKELKANEPPEAKSAKDLTGVKEFAMLSGL